MGRLIIKETLNVIINNSYHHQIFILFQCIQTNKSTGTHSHIPSPRQCSFHALKQAVIPTISTRNFTELLLHDFKKSSRFFIPEFIINSSPSHKAIFHIKTFWNTAEYKEIGNNQACRQVDRRIDRRMDGWMDEEIH